MSEKMFVKPSPDLRVVDPATGNPLPAEGAEVPRTSYWMRRLQDQDVLEVPAPVVAVDGPAKSKSKREA